MKLYEIFLKHPLISTDTRNIASGAIFFALKGENFNGNKFAAKALEAGAAYVVVDEGETPDERYIKVDDVLSALQELAAHHRSQLKIPVVGIGGSNGKTTTKELVNVVLGARFKVLATRGNLNNHIGVPLTLLQINAGHEIAVIELGTNNPGEIEFLCKIADPDFGLITNIGKEHLEGFGSIEGVAEEEAALFRHLSKRGGLAFVNADDEMVTGLAKNLNKRTFSFNGKESVDYPFHLYEAVPEIKWSMDGQEGRSVLSGAYNFNNIMAAASLGKYFGVPVSDIVNAVASYIPQNNRSQWISKNSNNIFLDCYNANPSSMEVALEAFAKLERKPKIAVVGDMFELGAHSEEEHRSIAELIARLHFDKVYCVGAEFSKHAAIMRAQAFESSKDLAAFFSANPPQNSWFIFKASRGIALEKALEF